MKKKNFGNVLVTAGVMTGAFAVLHIVGKRNKKKNEAGIDDDNQYLNKTDDGKKPNAHPKPSGYERVWKPVIDKALSFEGLVVLAPIYGVISLAIVIDDPGPVLFTQKRVGKDKHFFKLHKFRSMKMSTPHDVPTHMLENPEQYITKVGKFLRKTSLDELPQIWDIFVGNMSVIGPRPALWNQADLIEERDKYGANDSNPGLTGWAQINGRDELEIPDKAKLDGDYTKMVGKGGLQALIFDVKCFLGTFLSVLREDGVVEGGTGTTHKKFKYEFKDTNPMGIKGEDDYQIKSEADTLKPKPALDIAFEKKSEAIDDTHHNVLIVGKGSYIGTHVKDYLENFDYSVKELEAQSDDWKTFNFSPYDVVYQVAGIAHIKETEENANLYYEVNRDLAYTIAKRCKEAGVKRFIYMSSMSVYGLKGSKELLTISTTTSPTTNYGKSKLQAEEWLTSLADESFTVSLLRPPMVYGPSAPGNLGKLFDTVRKYHVFPTVKNERSSISIDNLAIAIKQIIEHGYSGVVIPQDDAYRCTTDVVREQMKEEGVKVHFTSLFNPAVILMIGRVGVATKVFGDLKYAKSKKVHSNVRVARDMFSILVLSYNNSEYLFESLDSIIKQDYSNIEIVIADDHSKDFDPNIYNDYIKKNNPKNNIKNIIAYSNEENYGTVKSANIALKKSSGGYIKLLAADDALYDENTLKEAKEALDKSSNGIISGDVFICDSELNNPEKHTDYKLIDALQATQSDKLFKLLCIHNYLMAGSVFFTREFFEKYGCFDEKYRLLEDWPTWMKVLSSGGHIDYVPVKAILYRSNGGIGTSMNPFYLSDRKRVFETVIKPAKNKIGVYNYLKAKISFSFRMSPTVRKIYSILYRKNK